MKIQELDQPEDKIAAFLKYANSPKGFMILAGKNGTGKTTAAMTIYNQASVIETIDHNPKHFYVQTDLYEKWTSYRNQWGDTSGLIKELQGTSLLVLDDLGTRVPSDAFKDFLYAIIEKREREKHKTGTIITTNLNSMQMRGMFGDAIVSRIASNLVFRFEGNDRRFKKEF